jgi:hypothetical protein
MTPLEPLLGALLVALLLWDDSRRQRALQAWREELRRTQGWANAYLLVASRREHLKEASRFPSYRR